MKKLLLICLMSSSVCLGETIATLPNQGGGKIVLTNEPCKVGDKNYLNLNRVYNYGSTGQTMEGCFKVEDETVVVVWVDGTTFRYPAENFTIRKKYQAL